MQLDPLLHMSSQPVEFLLVGLIPRGFGQRGHACMQATPAVLRAKYNTLIGILGSWGPLAPRSRLLDLFRIIARSN